MSGSHFLNVRWFHTAVFICFNTNVFLFVKEKSITIWASAQENLSSVVCNNKGVDQPAHPRRLISAFVIRVLESIISNLATSKILIFKLVSIAEETGLSLALSELLKTGLRPIFNLIVHMFFI